MPARSQPAEEAGTLSVRRILAPGTVSAAELSWQVQPGGTFLAGSPLATLQSAATGIDARDVLCLLVFMLSCGCWRLGRLAGEQVLTAPEDGILTWCLPAAGPGRLRRGTLLATYLPLRAWEAYEGLLRRQDGVITANQAAALPTLRAEEARSTREVAALKQQLSLRRQEDQRILQGTLGKLTEQLTTREAEFDPAVLDAHTANTLRQLARQLGNILQKSCPLPPTEFFSLCDACLGNLLVQEERFRRLDNEFHHRYRQAQSAADKEQLLDLWQQRKVAMVERIGISQEDSDLLP